MRMRSFAWATSVLLMAGSVPAGAQDLHGDEHHDHAASAAHSHDDEISPKSATLLPGYGSGGFTLATKVSAAQAFFSNGMELGAAFAHTAATKAMHEASRLDPACAMCRWGEALVAGPTINFGKDADERKPLARLVDEASRLAKASGTARERDLIAALALRYRPGGKPYDHDQAYSTAMRTVAAKYPDDDAIAVLAADALLVTVFAPEHPGDVLEFDHKPIGQAITLLETVLRRNPDFTPAIHFYIHAEEVLDQPEKAEPYADKLASLAPNASHLVHMPSHTFYWLGRYQEAADTNWRAVEIGKANAARLGLAPPMGVWGLPYHAHNVIFGLGGALMAGDSRMALTLARPLVERSATEDGAPPAAQLLSASGYFALARFDDPAAVLALPEPKMPYLKAARHYARGEALLWLRDLAGARAELAAIPVKIGDEPVKGDWEHDNRAPEAMLAITRKVLEGRIALIEGRAADAARLFGAAADLEETPDFRRFSDPPAFWYPVRRDEAAALLASDDAPGARRAAQASLRLRPRDPVALAVLARAEGALPAVH